MTTSEPDALERAQALRLKACSETICRVPLDVLESLIAEVEHHRRRPRNIRDVLEKQAQEGNP